MYAARTPMPAVRRTRLVEAIWRLHRWLYRASGGRIGGRVGGLPILVLTTRGRRSGQARDAALAYFEDAGRLVVVASNAGEGRPPAWWRNLQAQPEASVRLGGATRRVRAVEASGAERDRLWAELVRRDPSYDAYRQRTDRQIPVVLLEPLPPATTRP